MKRINIRKIKKFIMDNSYVKTFGIIFGAFFIIVFFILKVIFSAEITNTYTKIKEYMYDLGNRNSDEDYVILIEQSKKLANNFRYGEAIECYRSAVNLLDEENDIIEIAKCYAEIGVLYLSSSEIITAVDYLDQSWELVEDIELTTDNYYEVCNIYLNVALGRIQYNEFQEALIIYKDVLNIYDEMNNVYSEERALIYDKLASLYYKLGDMPNAIEYVEKAREMIEGTSGSANTYAASIYGTICLIYSDIDYEYAKKYGERAYQIISSYNEKNSDIISICQALSYLYTNTDRSKSYNYALERYNYAKLLFGEMNIDTILSQMVLADYESNEKKVSILEELNKKVIANYGEYSIETAIIWNGLANAYMGIYNETEAEKIYLQCLHIYENLLGPEHPYVASVYYDLALWAKNAGEHLLQISYAEKAQEIYRNRYGEMYFEVAGLYLLLGDAEFVYSGDYNKSLRLYENAKQIYIGLYGEMNAFVADCNERRANIYIWQHDLATADELICTCIEIYENEYGSVSDKMARVLVTQSQLNLYNKKFDLAITNANRAMDICKLYGRENSPFASEVYYILCSTYYEKK